jgi:hypothetical protein
MLVCPKYSEVKANGVWFLNVRTLIRMVSMFLFPTDEKFAAVWTKEVKRSRSDFDKPIQSSCLCSAHFSREMLDNSCLLANEWALAKQIRLRPDAIPVICKPDEKRVRYETVFSQHGQLLLKDSARRQVTVITSLILILFTACLAFTK